MRLLGQSDAAAMNDQAGVVHRSRPFAEILCTNGPEGLRRLAVAFEKVVKDSYVTHPMRHATTAEDRRRTRFLIETFRELQGDLSWTSDRCLSLLRDALDAKLSGRAWAPPTKQKTLWAPDGTLFEVRDPADEPAGD